MHKGFIRLAAFLGAASVILGAFAAHQLKAMVSDKAVGIFETAVRYQFYHVFALALAGILFKPFTNNWVKAAGYFFISGIILFSGSLYILTYKTALVLPGLQWVGPITPIGGLLFILGWISLGVGIRREKNT